MTVAVASTQAAVSAPQAVAAAEIGTACAPAFSAMELASAMRGSQNTPVIPAVMFSPLFVITRDGADQAPMVPATLFMTPALTTSSATCVASCMRRTLAAWCSSRMPWAIE
ncbi:Uncharacterised protein [Mycobacteroides abscessus subsp. abscessus]|nr:Uncharacterised protein [Mycobacteroides abscessus subsp. abscessus]